MIKNILIITKKHILIESPNNKRAVIFGRSLSQLIILHYNTIYYIIILYYIILYYYIIIGWGEPVAVQHLSQFS